MEKKYSIEKSEENGIMKIDVQFEGKVFLTARKPRDIIVSGEDFRTTGIIQYREKNKTEKKNGKERIFVRVIREKEETTIKEADGLLFINIIYNGRVFDVRNNALIEEKSSDETNISYGNNPCLELESVIKPVVTVTNVPVLSGQMKREILSFTKSLIDSNETALSGTIQLDKINQN